MKLELNGYEVEIKAKRKLVKDRFNKEDTMNFLNELSLLLGNTNEDDEANQYFRNEANKLAHKIYMELEKAGAYKDL